LSSNLCASPANQAKPNAIARFGAAALFLLLSLCLVGRGLVGSEALYYRDILHTYWPLHFIAALGRSRLSEWNPMHNVGVPLLGYVHEGVFYPPNLLFQFLEFPRAYCAHLLLHHFFASLGMYWLCRRLGFGRPASLGGAVAFSLTGFLVGLVYHGPFLSSAAYVPWVGAIILGRAPLLARGAGLASILCLQVFTGEPQLVIFSAVLGFAVAFIVPGRGREALALAGALGLAALLGSVQLLPTWQLFKETTRSETAGFASEWALHPLRLLGTILPYPFGGYLEAPQFWAWFTNKGPGTVPWALSVYLGSSTVVLAVFGMARSRRACLGLTLFLIGVAVAAGIHLPGLSLIHAVPPFRFFRYPQKYFLLSVLGAAILVSGGLQAMLERRVGPSLAGTALVISGVAFILGLVLMCEAPWAISAGRAVLAWASTAGDPRAPVAALRSSLLLGAPCAAAVSVLGLASSRTTDAPARLPQVTWVYLAIAVIAVDLSLAAQRLVWFGPIEFFRTVPPLVAELKRAMPFEPARFSRDDERLDPQAPHSRTLEELQILRAWELNTLKSNLGAVFGLEEASGRLPFSLQRYQAFMNALSASPAKRAALLNSCVIATASSAPPPSDTHLVFTNANLRLSLLLNSRCLPRLRSVQNVEQVESASQAVSRVADPSFDFEASAAVEGEPSAKYGTALIEAARWSMDGVVAKVHAGASGAFVVYATVFYPGWHAQVDGLEVPVRAVDGLLVGARVPSGTHTLGFHFHEPLLAPGAWLSGVGVIAMLASLFWTYRGRVLACGRE